MDGIIGVGDIKWIIMLGIIGIEEILYM
jgi:hypothetical protein